MKWIVLLAAGVLACSGGAQRATKPDSTAKAGSTAKAPGLQRELPVPTVRTPPNSTAVLPAMPRYPDASRGHMAVVSAGPAGSEPITRDWAAEAGSCQNPARLLVKSDQVGLGGTLVMLQLPEQKSTTYPITGANPQPPPPAAQLGVQVYNKMGPVAYQAVEGSVEVSRVDQVVSGRFSVTLREVSRNERIQYAGSFREVPIASLDSTRCAPVAVAGATPNPDPAFSRPVEGIATPPR